MTPSLSRFRVVAAALGALGLPSAASATPPRVLTPGAVVARAIGEAETHRYEVALAAGQYLHATIEHFDAQLDHTLAAPTGRALVQGECPGGEFGQTVVAVVADEDGTHLLDLKAAAGTPKKGRYELRVETVRTPSAQDRARARAAALVAEGTRLFAQRRPRDSMERFRRALHEWEELGDRRSQAYAASWIAGLHGVAFDEYQEAAEVLRRHLPAAGEAGDRWAEARMRFNLAQALDRLGEPEEARAQMERALAFHQAAGQRRRAAQALSALGNLLSLAGALQEALDSQTAALRLLESMGDARRVAVARTELAATYRRLGAFERVLEEHRLALPALASDPLYRARAIAGNAWAHAQLGDRATAQAEYEQAIALYREVPSPTSEANVLLGVGDLHVAEGRLDAARTAYAAALEVFRVRGHRPSEARAQCRLGEVARQAGDRAGARAALDAALAAAPEDAVTRVCAAEGRARLARDEGDLKAARSHGEAALALAESSRSALASQAIRATALAQQQALYELVVDVRMRAHRAEPEGGHAAAALEASERARARSLLELLAEGRLEVRGGADAALLDEERRLRRRLNARAALQEQLSGTTKSARQRLAQELARLANEIADVQARIRVTSPHYAALTQPQPLTLEQIRAEVLDDDTQLVEYFLGDAASYMWIASRDRLASFELGPRAPIEAAARRAYERLSAPRDGPPSDDIAALGALVLPPQAVAALDRRRLLVVAPGAMQHVPFAALPVAIEGRTETLLSRFEVVSAPSVSVLATLRREARARPRASKRVAVFADPVFDFEDPRLRPGAASAAASVRGVPLTRLPFSRQEAEGILSLVPRAQSLRALGFEASREAALSPDIGDYRMLHFATHGVVDTRQPELSGVVLSLVDRRGRPRDGWLRLHDVFNLRLGADLVVLSGCRTALGRDMGGEGLVGLTRGFMYAGAPRVVASLWQVDDVATAELMKRFYRAMIERDLSPAAALREAQREMASSKRWASPYFWAAFVLQGEWR